MQCSKQCKALLIASSAFCFTLGCPLLTGARGVTRQAVQHQVAAKSKRRTNVKVDALPLINDIAWTAKVHRRFTMADLSDAEKQAIACVIREHKRLGKSFPFDTPVELVLSGRVNYYVPYERRRKTMEEMEACMHEKAGSPERAKSELCFTLMHAQGYNANKSKFNTVKTFMVCRLYSCPRCARCRCSPFLPHAAGQPEQPLRSLQAACRPCQIRRDCHNSAAWGRTERKSQRQPRRH